MGFHKFIRHFGSTTSTHDRAALVEGQLLDTNQQETSHATTDWHSRLAFFVFGLANNFPFVVMLSAAEDILARNSPNLSTGVVLLADVLPDLLVKATLPFVMQGWSFKLRVTLVALFNAIGFITVALSNATWLSLLGVAAASLSSALGDITFLSLTSFYSKSTISFWSSGTGAAGFLGSLCYLALSVIMSPSAALLAMLVGPVMMLICYFCVLKHPSISSHATSPTSSSHLDSITLHSVTVDTQTGDVSTQSLLPVGNTHDARATSVSPDDHEIDADQGIEHRKRSVLGRFLS